MSNRGKLGSALLLLLASFIWGTAFVAQSAGMQYIGPFTFSVVRGLMAAVFLLPLSFLADRAIAKPARAPIGKEIGAGLLLGVVLFFAANLQQLGLVYTTAGKAGFITSLYIVLVPLFGLLLHQRPHPVIWFCVPLSLIGFFLLSVTGGLLSIGKGDLYVLLCAFAFTIQILLVARFAPGMNVIRLCCIQFFIVSLLSVPLMLLTEEVSLPAIRSAWFTLFYSGVLSGGVAYSLQMLAQKNLDPAAASLLCSPESVFAALGGAVLLGERMTGREITGCMLVFLAVVLSQIPWGRFHRQENML